MKNIDVLVIGRSCLDYIAVVNQFPEENQKVPLEFRLAEGGGQGGTAACCVAKLGGRVAYMGKLGDDDEGRFCLKRLSDFGITSEFIDIVPGGKTPVAYIFVTAASGARTIVFERSALPKLSLNDTLKGLLAQSETVLLDPETTYLGKRLESLTNSKVKLVYDCERWHEGIENIMETADFFIPSSEFLKSEVLNFGDTPLYQKIIRLNDLVKGTLVVTHGEEGAYYIFRNALCHVGVPDVNAIDTIGAGDSFHGAFAYAIKKGLDLHQAVKFSVAVASLSCQEYGGRKGLPDFQEATAVAQRLKERVVLQKASNSCKEQLRHRK